MADRDTLERLAENRKEIRDNETVKEMQGVLHNGGMVDFRNFKADATATEDKTTVNAMESAVTGNKKTNADFNSQEHQQEILQPQTRLVKLSWGELNMHKLSARNTVKFHGFALSVVSSAAQRPQNGTEILGLMAINSVVAEDDTIAMKLCFYAACATAEPGVLNMEQALKIGAELFNSCDSDDFLKLYAVLSDMTGFDKVLKGYTAKKAQPAPVEAKT